MDNPSQTALQQYRDAAVVMLDQVRTDLQQLAVIAGNLHAENPDDNAFAALNQAVLMTSKFSVQVLHEVQTCLHAVLPKTTNPRRFDPGGN